MKKKSPPPPLEISDSDAFLDVIHSDIRSYIEKDKVTVPALDVDVEGKILDAIAMYSNAYLWERWGMADKETHGTCIMLYGKPGTGKTTVGKYLSHRLEKPLLSFSFSDFGSQIPGQNERNLVKLFSDGEANGAIIFMDECDSILYSRDTLSGGLSWMVGTINELLKQISNYPHLIILATNRLGVLDAALERRILAKIEIPPPSEPTRKILWGTKIPKRFPFQPTDKQLCNLAKLSDGCTGADIEDAVRLCASSCIRANVIPNFRKLTDALKQIKHSRYDGDS